MKNIFLILLLVSGCNSKKNAETVSDFLPQNKLQNVVNDYSDLFTASQEDSLIRRLTAYEDKTTNQIVIVTTDSIAPYANIQEYATAVGNYWGVGQKEKDNGLTIALSTKPRRIGIATGRGTQKVLTDSICQQIISSTIIPQLKNDNYFKGISMGIDSILFKWK